MAINGSSEISLVYWAELQLSGTVTYRGAISGQDITWNNVIYPADSTFLSLGTSVYEISVANQPLELTVILNERQLQAVNDRRYVRRTARVWRANLASDGTLSDVQQIKNGFLDSHSDSEGSAISFTIASWLAISQDEANSPGRLTTGAQAIRDLGRASNKVTQSLNLSRLSATSANISNNLLIGDVLPEFASSQAVIDSYERTLGGTVISGTSFTNVVAPGNVLNSNSSNRTSTDNNYFFFPGDSRAAEATGFNDAVSGIPRFSAVTGSDVSYPFNIVTEGFTTSARYLDFDATLQGGGARVPTGVNNRRIGYRTDFPDVSLATITSGGLTVNSTPTWLPPDRLVNPDGLLQDRTLTLLIRGEFPSNYTIADEGGNEITGRANIANWAYDRLVALRRERASNPPGQVIEIEQALSLGPVDSVNISAPIFSNDYNRFTTDSSQSINSATEFANQPTSIQITINRNNAGTIVSARANSQNLTINSDGSVSGNIYASVMNSYYAPIALSPIHIAGASEDSAADQASLEAAAATRPPIGFWGCIQEDALSAYQGLVHERESDGDQVANYAPFYGGYPDATFYPADMNSGDDGQSDIAGRFLPSDGFGMPNRAIHNGGTDINTRRNIVMRFTYFPGDADGGKLSWIRWTIYNRAFEAAVISSRPNRVAAIEAYNLEVDRRRWFGLTIGDSGAPTRQQLRNARSAIDHIDFINYRLGTNLTNNTLNFWVQDDPDNRELPENLFRFTYGIVGPGASEPVDAIRDILTNLIAIDSDLLDARDPSLNGPGSFRTASVLNELNFRNLAGDLSRFNPAPTLASASLFPTSLSGASSPSSYTDLLEEIRLNTGLLPVEDKTDLPDPTLLETPIYLFSNLPRNTGAVNNGFSAVFNETNASFSVDFGRSSELPNTFLGNVRVRRTDTDTAEVVTLDSELSLVSEALRASDNSFVNIESQDLDFLQVNATFDPNTDQTNLPSGQITIPQNRASYLVMSRRLGLDTITINTDYNSAGSVRLGDFVQVQWSKFNWIGNNSLSCRVTRIEDDNRGRVTLTCQRHDNILNAGSAHNSFTTTFTLGSETRANVPGTSSTVSGGLPSSGGGTVVVDPNTGGTGGTTVIANPSGTDGQDLTRISISGANYNIAAGGTTVVANPGVDDDNADLTSVTIDGIDYNVSQPSLFYGFTYDPAMDDLQVVCVQSDSTDTVRVDGYLDWTVVPGDVTVELDDNDELILRF